MKPEDPRDEDPRDDYHLTDNYDREDNDNENGNQQYDDIIPKLRSNRQNNYDHIKGRDRDGSLPTIARPEEFGQHGKNHAHSHIILQSMTMAQYNLIQGIKKIGYKGKEDGITELQQLYDQAISDPLMNGYNNPEEHKGALQYLMSLKENESGIKVRGCVDGIP